MNPFGFSSASYQPPGLNFYFHFTDGRVKFLSCSVSLYVCQSTRNPWKDQHSGYNCFLSGLYWTILALWSCFKECTNHINRLTNLIVSFVVVCLFSFFQLKEFFLLKLSYDCNISNQLVAELGSAQLQLVLVILNLLYGFKRDYKRVQGEYLISNKPQVDGFSIVMVVVDRWVVKTSAHLLFSYPYP